MNLALHVWWKDLREQRVIWLTLAGASAAAVLGGIAALGHSGFDARGLERVWRELLLLFVFVMGGAFAVVSGSMLFAGEAEEGTQTFLDTLPVGRSRLWVVKAVGGLLATAAMSAALGLLTGLTGLARPENPNQDHMWIIFLIVLSLDAYLWSLLSSVLCRTVLSAAGVAAAFVLLTWTATLYVVAAGQLAYIPVRLGLGVLAAVASWRMYTKSDRSRAAVAAPARKGPAAWQTIVWLCWRQGKAVVVTSAAAALLLCFLPLDLFLKAWPLSTLTLGLACGLAVFAGEQVRGTGRFFGEQRLPATRLWLYKVGLWGLVAAGVAGAALLLKLFFAGLSFFTGGEWASLSVRVQNALHEIDPRLADLPLLPLLLMWLPYGFACGVLFPQLTRKAIAGVVLAVIVAAMLIVPWVPTLLVGGWSAWQLLVIPLALLLASRCLYWPWVSGRVWARGPVLCLLTLALFVPAWTAGNLYYRAVQIPDVGEPFDVAAFLAGIPPLEENEAGDAIREAVTEMAAWRREVDQEMTPVGAPGAAAGSEAMPGDMAGGEAAGPAPDAGAAPDELPPDAPGAAGMAAEPEKSFNEKLWEVPETGWPGNDKKLAEYLDKIFSKDWDEKLAKAVELPPGYLVNPRTLDIGSLLGPVQDCREAAALLAAKSLQLLSQGKLEEAWQRIDTTLSLANQVRSYGCGMSLLVGNAIEDVALLAYDRWLEEAAQNPRLLEQALRGLTEHEKAIPPAEQMMKVEHLMYRNSLPLLLDGRAIDRTRSSPWLGMMRLVPWERERFRRLFHAVSRYEFSRLGSGNFTFQPDRDENEGPYYRVRPASRLLGSQIPPIIEIPPGSGNHRQVQGPDLELLLLTFSDRMLLAPYTSLYDVRAARLKTAMALYKLRHGREVTDYSHLVPEYLPEVPRNPFTGGEMPTPLWEVRYW